jgi:hypothetical protein
MPKTVPCPTCQAEVKVPRDAEPGTELTCPECHGVFVPPQLRKKEYDPREEEGYAVGGVLKDRDRAEKKRKAKALIRHGRREAREARRSSSSPGALGGLEGVILILAIVAGAALALGYVVAKRAPRPGEAALIIVGYCGMFLLFGWRKLIGGRERLGG